MRVRTVVCEQSTPFVGASWNAFEVFLQHNNNSDQDGESNIYRKPYNQFLYHQDVIA